MRNWKMILASNLFDNASYLKIVSKADFLNCIMICYADATDWVRNLSSTPPFSYIQYVAEYLGILCVFNEKFDGIVLSNHLSEDIH